MTCLDLAATLDAGAAFACAAGSADWWPSFTLGLGAVLVVVVVAALGVWLVARG